MSLFRFYPEKDLRTLAVGLAMSFVLLGSFIHDGKEVNFTNAFVVLLPVIVVLVYFAVRSLKHFLYHLGALAILVTNVGVVVSASARMNYFLGDSLAFGFMASYFVATTILLFRPTGYPIGKSMLAGNALTTILLVITGGFMIGISPHLLWVYPVVTTVFSCVFSYVSAKLWMRNVVYEIEEPEDNKEPVVARLFFDEDVVVTSNKFTAKMAKIKSVLSARNGCSPFGDKPELEIKIA